MRDRVCERCGSDVHWKRTGGDGLGRGKLVRGAGTLQPEYCLDKKCPNHLHPSGLKFFDFTVPRNEYVPEP